MDALMIAACASAAAGGAFGWQEVASRARLKERVSRLKDASDLTALSAGEDLVSQGAARSILSRLVLAGAQSRVSQSAKGLQASIRAFTAAGSRLSRWMGRLISQAGLGSQVECAAAYALMRRFALMLAAAGAVFGSLISLAAALLFGVVGALIGAGLIPWALAQEREARTKEIERELPDMLDIVTLGLRSGMTFDLSFKLYPDYFDTPFSRACRAAYQRWAIGLASRSDALEDLARSYGSPQFERTVQGIIQSLRLGTSLASDLSQAAREAREAYRLKQEESVAKAPVKMMIPIGTMILPAMLLLVLGPVLLQLMSEL